LPLMEREIKIITDDFVDPKFGTGLVKVTPAHDPNDYEMGKRHSLEFVNIMHPNGVLNENAGEYSGMRIEDARKEIIKDLKDKGLLYKKEASVQRVPLCWRSKTPIEFIAMEEYYVKQTEFVDDLLEIARNGTFFPSHHRQVLIDWLNRVTVDWPVSRRRYYGTELPIWYCNS